MYIEANVILNKLFCLCVVTQHPECCSCLIYLAAEN
jgi:hypothetical protein